MRRLLVSLATALALTAAVVPAALAADPSPAAAPAATPVPTEAAGQPSPTPTGPFDGTIVEDPTFVSGGELPTQPPATGKVPRGPGLTPPPTDAPVVSATAERTMPVPLLALAAAAVLALLASPVTRAPRGPRRRGT